MANELSLSLCVPAELNPEGVVVRMAGTAEHPLFCLPDVCRVLDLSNPSAVADRLDEDERVKVNTNTLSQAEGIRGNPNLTFVTEAGLYGVILRSDKPNAKAVKRWVTHDVLPSIRKHGCYPPPPDASDPTLALLRQHQAELQVVERLYLAQRHQSERLAKVEKVAEAALEVARDNHGHYSVLGFARLQGWEMPLATAAQHGKELTAICHALGLETGKVRDPRFGQVNTYPESVLSDYFLQKPTPGVTPSP